MSENLALDDCINDVCPWSGKPVQEDSLTRYKGQTVGSTHSKFGAAFAMSSPARRRIGSPSASGPADVKTCVASDKAPLRSQGHKSGSTPAFFSLSNFSVLRVVPITRQPSLTSSDASACAENPCPRERRVFVMALICCS